MEHGSAEDIPAIDLSEAFAQQLPDGEHNIHTHEDGLQLFVMVKTGKVTGVRVTDQAGQNLMVELAGQVGEALCPVTAGYVTACTRTGSGAICRRPESGDPPWRLEKVPVVRYWVPCYVIAD
jgi:hypothetical protein